MWRKDSQIDWHTGNAFIGAGQSIGLILDLFPNLVKVDELFTLTVEKLGPFGRTIVEQFDNKRSTSDYTRASRQEISFLSSFIITPYYQDPYKDRSLTFRPSSREHLTFRSSNFRRRRFVGRFEYSSRSEKRHLSTSSPTESTVPCPYFQPTFPYILPLV